LNKKVNYYKHRISYLTGTCYNFELEEFLAWFRIARVCQRQLDILVYTEPQNSIKQQLSTSILTRTHSSRSMRSSSWQFCTKSPTSPMQ